MPDTAVVHLVWAPLGAGELEGFLAAFREHEPGCEHRLVAVLNGFGDDSEFSLATARSLLAGSADGLVVLPRPVLDLAAYRQAAMEIEAPRLCFLNSYSRPLTAGWLGALSAALSAPGVGAVGCGGSYESAYSSAPFWLRRRRKRDFPPFPNPSLRTNAFLIEREILLELEWPPLTSKVAAWSFESGRRSISSQLADRGLEVRVVGRDGVSYPTDRWPESSTFRSGGQRNLLVSDNRTRQYEQADAPLKRRLELMAWGSAAPAEATGGVHGKAGA